ncbi:conserved hypothetical protein [Methanocaldococcus vulcanius M7]|uniref:Uncharacterized protein n=1 Tax=Methanocaldococcus vulcanius (strain ATCC 700851 / DSM 12094 / M7) TaxID=579137 RepID=C9RE04_METVM|nr:hypothetical protein [Methanocaldococcus vulcanius]ACX73533.1 conserved hypothetical protein [Methanocaldococcus vulcanius M7]
MEKVIINSMKKVFSDEIRDIEIEINNILEKYGVKTKKELKEKISNGEIDRKEAEEDLEKIELLEKNLNRIMECLREINVKSL